MNQDQVYFASDLNLAPGQWPETFAIGGTFPEHLEKYFVSKDNEGDVQYVDYKVVSSHLGNYRKIIRIFND